MPSLLCALSLIHISPCPDTTPRKAPAQGTVALRKAARAHLLEATGVDYPVARIIVSTGAKQVIFNGLAATLNDGDEVLIPAPFWVSYPDMVLVNGGVPVAVSTTPATDYKLSLIHI